MSEVKNSREEILRLQAAMQEDQGAIAKELVELVASEDMAKLVDKFEKLRDRAIPGQTLDQQITQYLMMIGHLSQVGAQLYQQFVQQQSRG